MLFNCCCKLRAKLFIKSIILYEMKEFVVLNTNTDEKSELLMSLFLRMEILWDITGVLG